MKPNENKMHGALAELKSARSNIRHFVSDALKGEITEIKKDVLSELNNLLEEVESFLRYLMKTDLAKEWRDEV